MTIQWSMAPHKIASKSSSDIMIKGRTKSLIKCYHFCDAHRALRMEKHVSIIIYDGAPGGTSEKLQHCQWTTNERIRKLMIWNTQQTHFSNKLCEQSFLIPERFQLFNPSKHTFHIKLTTYRNLIRPRFYGLCEYIWMWPIESAKKSLMW